MSVSTSTPTSSSSSTVPIKNILITGTSRGIGLEMVRQYLENESNIHVYATARNIENAKDLQQLAKKYSNLSLIQLDISSQSSIQSSLKSLPPISLLINNAGISTSGPEIHSQESAVFEDIYRTNSIGPAIVINTVLPALQEAVKLNQKPIVVNISSIVASCSELLKKREWIILLPYRMSKAALNMLTAYHAAQHKDITFVSVHPGWVATDLGTKDAPLTPQVAVTSIRQTIENVKPEQSGLFLDGAHGQQIEW